MIIHLPHNEIIVGMIGSGKTWHLLSHLDEVLISNESLRSILIICPTIRWNITFLNWKPGSQHRNKIRFIGCSQDSVNSELRKIILREQDKKHTHRGLKTLVVLDDCAHGSDVKGKTSELVELGYTGRHPGIGVIVLTQQLTSIAKAYRENVTRLVTFYNPNKEDSLTLFEEYLGDVSPDERKEIFKKLKSVRWSHLTVSLTYPYNWEVTLPKVNPSS